MCHYRMKLDIVSVNCRLSAQGTSGSKKEQESFERECVKIIWKNLFRMEGVEKILKTKYAR